VLGPSSAMDESHTYYLLSRGEGYDFMNRLVRSGDIDSEF
jgi:hypothetical protein